MRGFWIVAMATIAILAGCGKDPALKYEPDEKEVNSIASLKLLYKGYPVKVGKDVYFTGGVISSDQRGVLTRSLIIEDSTGGITMRVDETELFRYYPRGSTVTVRCEGLTLGSYGGSLQLGAAPTGKWETDMIAAGDISSHINLSSAPQQVIKAHTLSIGQLSARYVNCWVRIENIQFIDGELGQEWGDPDMDIDRHIIDREGNTLPVRIDASSRLVLIELPSGSGFIEGILGYFNGYQLRPISNAETSMNQPRF